ncbi:MAG: anion permease, partial [Oscillospiraceae bacterium]
MTQTKENSKKRGAIIAVAFIFILFFKYLPAPKGLSVAAMQVMGIFIGSLILWMSISIDWPSMLCIAALAFVPGMKMSKILAEGVGNSTFSFLMFTFMCTYTLSRTPFIRRCAIWFLSTKIAQKGPWYFILLYFVSVLFLGSFMSPTVLVVIMIAVTEEIYGVLGLEKGDRTANMMMLGMVFVSGIAAGMTPVAHVFPLMAMGYYTTATGQAISYASYMAVGVPVAIITMAAMILIFRFILKPDLSAIKSFDVSKLKNSQEPMDNREKYSLIIFFAVVALWVVPGIIKPFAPQVYNYINGFGTAMPPLLGAVAMAIITCEGKPLLNFSEATSKGVPWASLIMVAATLSLGSAMTNEEIGLTAWIGEQIAPLATTLAPLALVFLFILWACIQTNFSSNMVTVTVVCAIALPITLATGGGVNAAAVASLVGMMASFAFA